MRVSVVACLAILAFSHPAAAIDIQPGDRAAAVQDGIACSDWNSFESYRDTDPRNLKSRLPVGCLIIHGDPVLLVVDVVKQGSGAVCVHFNTLSGGCFWFSLDKIIVGLSDGQRRI